MTRHKKMLIRRIGGMVALLLGAFLASGVVLAQSSDAYDLGCRSELTAGGTWTYYPGPNVQLLSSFGQWNAGKTVVQGSGIVVHSGYVLSAAQVSSSASSSAAVSDSTEGSTQRSAVILDGLYLPAIYATKVIRYVRPCNWPWASSSAVPTIR